MNRPALTLLACALITGCASTPSPTPCDKVPSTKAPSPDATVVPVAPVSDTGEQAAPTAAETSCPHQAVKSRDGEVSGDIWGVPSEGSGFAKLEIGMTPAEVRTLIGAGNESNLTYTWKRFIPFYIGADGFREEVFYKGQGSLVYTGGGYGDQTGRLITIKHNSGATGFAH